MYQDFSTSNDWPVEKPTVDLPIKMKRNSKCTSVIRRVQVGSVWFRLFGTSLNTAEMKYVTSKVLNVLDLS